MTTPTGTPLLDDASIEVTGRDEPLLAAAAAHLGSGTRVNVTSLGSESTSQRVGAARTLVRLGLRPVPHLSARRIADADELDGFLAALGAEGAAARVMVLGGDPATPAGPYASALDLIRSGALERAGVREAGLAGYPQGHPDLADDVLRTALHDKARALQERGLAGEITTQFGFDATAVLAWLERLRGDGIDLPVRVGVAGPVDARRLLGYARRFGIGANAMILRKYGLSLGALVGRAGPDRFVDELVAGLDTGRHGAVRLHLYTFGDPAGSAAWLARR